MKKEQAKKLFGGTIEKLGKAVGRGKSAISQWPEDLTDDQVHLVLGAAVRRGIQIPKELVK